MSKKILENTLPINPLTWFLSIPPETIRKPEVFLRFQGVWKETSVMKWISDDDNHDFGDDDDFELLCCMFDH